MDVSLQTWKFLVFYCPVIQVNLELMAEIPTVEKTIADKSTFLLIYACFLESLSENTCWLSCCISQKTSYLFLNVFQRGGEVLIIAQNVWNKKVVCGVFFFPASGGL